MSYLYINENGASLSLEAGYFVVKNHDEEITKIPVTIIGRVVELRGKF